MDYVINTITMMNKVSLTGFPHSVKSSIYSSTTHFEVLVRHLRLRLQLGYDISPSWFDCMQELHFVILEIEILHCYLVASLNDVFHTSAGPMESAHSHLSTEFDSLYMSSQRLYPHQVKRMWPQVQDSSRQLIRGNPAVLDVRP